MSNLWTILLPLVIGSALPPIQTVITIMLLRSEAGKRTAVAYVAGMTAVRLLQGIIFGLVLSSDSVSTSDADETSLVTAVVLLIVGILFLVMAIRLLLGEPDPDAAPPKWITATETMRPGKAFLVGAGVMAIGVKFWVFTLGAISAIGDADLGRSESIIAFIVFVVLAESVHLTVLGMSFALPGRSAVALGRLSDWLQRNNRAMVIALGLVFGVWFVVKALDGMGVI